MENKQYIVTIEVCSSKIVGVLAEKDPGGNVSVAALEAVELSPGCVRRGFVQNVEEAKSQVAKVIKTLETRIAPATIQSVYVGVAGRSLHNVPVEKTLQLDGNQLISEAMINNLSLQCREADVDGEILHVEPRIYVLDGNQETQNPIGCVSSRITAKMNLIVAKHSLKTNLQGTVEPILNVKGYIVTPLAVADKILKHDERQLGCMLLDFGAETTTVSIYKNGALQYLATLPMGSRLITLDITKMSVVETKAEDLKRTVGNAIELDVKSEQIIDGVRVNDVSNYVLARIGEIGANIAAQLGYAGMTEEEIAAGGVTIIGAGSFLNGFDAFVQKTLKLKAAKGQHCPFVNLLAPEAGNFAYIQSVALAATAAELIPNGESCVLTPKEDPVEEPDDDKPEKPDEPKKPGKLARMMSKLRDKAAIVFDGDDNDNDNYSDDDEEEISTKY